MTESSSTDTSIAKPQGRFSLGVLFVHGIGNQACGDTLVECAGAVYRWLKEWCSGLFRGEWTVALFDTFLQDGVSPASTRLVFRRGESIGRESWLLAESWWAQTFKTPTFREVAYWSVVIVPLAILMHMGPRLRNAMCLIQRGVDAGEGPRTSATSTAMIRDFLRGFSEIARCTLLTLILVPVGVAVQCLIAGLLVLAIFPIKALRDLVGAAQRALASVVGDSFIFVTSPVQEAAIISKFQRDLRWLSERCEKVVVVALSQGAAVAYKGLERLDWDGHMPEQVKLLVTLGSGLRKLVDLEQAFEPPTLREDTRGSWRSFNSRAWTVIALSLGVLGGLVSLFLSVTNPWVSALTIALCLPALSLWLGGIGVGRDEGSPPLSCVFWQDYYSSHDPVPNGALLGDFDHPYRRSFDAWRNPDDHLAQSVDYMQRFIAVVRRPKFYEVYNLGSVLLDHTAYWSNMDGFVSSVVRTLGRFPEIGIPLGTHDEEWLELAARRRRWRVRLLVRLRRVAMLGSVALVLFHQPLLTRLGGEVMARLSYLSFLPGWTQQAFTHYSFAGSLGGVCGMIGLYVLALWGWRRWENSDFRTFFARQPYKRWGGGLIFFAVTGAVLIAISAWFVVTALSEMLDNGWSLMTLVAGSITLAVWISARAPGVGVKWAQAGTPVTGA